MIALKHIAVSIENQGNFLADGSDGRLVMTNRPEDARSFAPGAKAPEGFRLTSIAYQIQPVRESWG